MLDSKYKKYRSQSERLKKAFSGYPKTMLQVSKQTGIERAYICYRLADLQDKNQINLVGFGLCPISKHRAGFYLTKETTNDGADK